MLDGAGNFFSYLIKAGVCDEMGKLKPELKIPCLPSGNPCPLPKLDDLNFYNLNPYPNEFKNKFTGSNEAHKSSNSTQIHGLEKSKSKLNSKKNLIETLNFFLKMLQKGQLINEIDLDQDTLKWIEDLGKRPDRTETNPFFSIEDYQKACHILSQMISSTQNELKVLQSELSFVGSTISHLYKPDFFLKMLFNFKPEYFTFIDTEKFDRGDHDFRFKNKDDSLLNIAKILIGNPDLLNKIFSKPDLRAYLEKEFKETPLTLNKIFSITQPRFIVLFEVGQKLNDSEILSLKKDLDFILGKLQEGWSIKGFSLDDKTQAWIENLKKSNRNPYTQSLFSEKDYQNAYRMHTHLFESSSKSNS
jgi:hypothetical protein